jgi:tRNA threonylcarbamoyladenosine biosynthesis protein TsaB
VRLLAFDTSSSVSAVALVDGETILAEDDSPSSARHGEVLLPRIQAVLAAGSIALAEVDAFAVGVGPGSFTGLRVGLATAKGLALACGRPLVAACSLRVLALAAFEHLPTHGSPLVLVAIDAFKGEVYGSLYERAGDGPRCLLEVFHAAPESAARMLKQALPAGADRALHACGDGARRHAEALCGATGASLLPDACDRPRGRFVAADALFRLASEGPSDLATLEPRYVRGSDARLPDRPLRVE